MFDQFTSEQRASSEAVAHGVLFVFMIGLIASLSVVGGDAIEKAEGTQSIEMGINGFVNVHQKAIRFTEFGSENNFATSGLQSNVKSINAEIYRNEDTTISIERNDGTDVGDIVSEPIVMDHKRYKIYYDTGVISEVSDAGETKVIHWTPVDNYQSRDGVLQLTTTRIKPNSLPANDDVNRVFITQQQSPETVVLNDGAWINVTTGTEYGWEKFLGKYDGFLTIPSTENTDGDGEVKAKVDIDSDEEVLIHHQKVDLKFS